MTPAGHTACSAFALVPPLAIGCMALEQIALHGPEISNAVGQLSIYAPQIPAATDRVLQLAQDAFGNGQQAGQGGNTAGPGGIDPNDPLRPFRDVAERFQHQTSGTRFGEEIRLTFTQDGKSKTVDVDGIVEGFLHESKYIDSSSSFYSKPIGQYGTGLDIHVKGWANEFERLSIAARQNGYNGVKVFTNSQKAIDRAKALFEQEEWFRSIDFVLWNIE